MKTKSPILVFVFLFPIMFVVGILIYVAYSLRMHDAPGIDWLFVFVAALVLDLVFTWFNRRDFSGGKKDA